MIEENSQPSFETLYRQGTEHLHRNNAQQAVEFLEQAHQLQPDHLDAAINFWHFSARLKTAGMQELISVQEILPALGIETAVPLLGWVFDQDWATEHRPALTAFLTAARAAARQLDQSDAEWERIRPLTKAEDDATLVALRDAYRAGIPQRFGDAERTAAGDLFEVLAKEGGETLVGSSRSLSPGTFWADFEIEAWR